MTAPIATEKASLIFRPRITRAPPLWVNPVISVAVKMCSSPSRTRR